VSPWEGLLNSIGSLLFYPFWETFYAGDVDMFAYIYREPQTHLFLVVLSYSTKPGSSVPSLASDGSSIFSFKVMLPNT